MHWFRGFCSGEATCIGIKGFCSGGATCIGIKRFCSGGAHALVSSVLLRRSHMHWYQAFLHRRSNMFIALRSLASPAPLVGGMYTERPKAHGAPLERIGIGVVRL